MRLCSKHFAKREIDFSLKKLSVRNTWKSGFKICTMIFSEIWDWQDLINLQIGNRKINTILAKMATLLLTRFKGCHSHVKKFSGNLTM